MQTRSQARRATIEDDTSSIYTEESDSQNDDVSDDESIEGGTPLCSVCGKHSESLSNYKGDSWCVKCINADKIKDSERQKLRGGSQKWSIWCMLIVSASFLVGLFFVSPSSVEFPNSDSNEETLNCSDLKAEMKQLRLNFSTQETDTWLNFDSGISLVLPGSDPAGSVTFLLMHEDKARQTADRIAREVGRLAAGCLGGKLLHLNGTSMTDRSQHKHFLQNYKKKVEESRVLYVSEFEVLPSEVAKEFHFFCDSYTPLVPQTIYILLLQVDQLPAGDDINAAAELHLKRIWANKLQSNVIQPLIARITANVVRIFE